MCLLTGKGWYKSPWSSKYYGGLLGEKKGFESQARHENEIRKVFLGDFLSVDFWQKL